MDIVRERFNLYLLLALTATLLCGCQTGKGKKDETTLRIHAEATENTSFTRTVKIFKNESVSMDVHDLPMLTDRDVTEAKVVNTVGGGFAISLKFNSTAKWMLDHHTSQNIGRHLAIFVMFGKDPSISRWIAAPIISQRWSDGMIIFTPDATREEAEQIVAGLKGDTNKGAFEKEDAEAKQE